ncbi:primosome component [Candidatus Magnetobacterium bavaricum]|uniref:Primosome component n=1 Tax=Candidatus Magnetobacterium bavaricum TaxID=29290 RepID=A0A0F3GWU4_9BACT|nr:primosome component [Candidatus Magnetobacterium bavaricum]
MDDLERLAWEMPPVYHRVFYWLRQNMTREEKLVPVNRGVGVWLTSCMLLTSYDTIARGVSYYERGIEHVPSKKTIGSVLSWLQRNGVINYVSNSSGTTITVHVSDTVET